MNKWYRSGLVKGILIVLQHVFAVMIVISMLWMAVYPGLIEDLISGKDLKAYKDSEGFSRQVFYESQNILNGMSECVNYETNGTYDEKKIVDIGTYHDEHIITNENKSGLAYYLGDLLKWEEGAAAESSNGSASSQDPVIVCKKIDGTYDYYHYSDFSELVDSGELTFVIDNNSTDVSEADILSELRNGTMYQGSGNLFSAVTDKDNQVLYGDCWNYDGYWIEEKYAPIGAESIIEVVNNNPEWNGKLNQAYQEVSTVIHSVAAGIQAYREVEELWQEGDTNLTYYYADLDAEKIYTNRSELAGINDLQKSVESLKEAGSYVVVRPKLADFETNMKGIGADTWHSTIKELGTSRKNFVFVASVDTRYPIQDNYYSENKLYSKYAPQIRSVVIMGILSLVLLITALIWLTCIAGRSNKDEELHLHPIDRWKTEITAAIIFFAWFVPMWTLLEAWNTRSYDGAEGFNGYYSYNVVLTGDMYSMVLGAVVAVFTCAMFLVGYLSLVRRIKARTLWRNSFLKWFLDFLVQLFANIHYTWKTVVIFGGFLIIHWIAAAASYSGFWILTMFAAEILAGIYLIKQAIGNQRIRTGIERIAGGEVDYKIPLNGMRGDQLLMAERVNAIGQGLDAAVEESMKSERLKTDLITNVSHDIKTPLTSIINYVDLLKRENFTDPKILGYLDVLEAKAQRLKNLTEDVVEASKVSSGNISLEYMNINLVEMIQQTSGEFEEKFKKRNLTEVLRLPEGEAVIRVDGRRMWRVLENIYNNAAKYAMENTRIYADLNTTDKEVIFTLKNISEQPLNITADELTERFIRGDISRSTEGSGLGLSIAKSLTKMQGGRFDLYLDGDLFRVTVTFPRIAKVQEDEPS